MGITRCAIAATRRTAVDFAAAPSYSSRMRIVLIASLASALALAACGDDGGSTPAIDAASSVTKVPCAGATVAATVTTVGFAYDPASTTVTTGQIVKFTMPGDHNAVSNSGLFRADFNAETCLRFDAAGSFPFHCEPHNFAGTIVVQ